MIPPPSGKSFLNGRLKALVVRAVVDTVSVAPVAAPPVTLPEPEQVGAIDPAGPVATTQVKLTMPVKPPAGVTVIVPVPLWPGLATVMALDGPVSVKLGMGAVVTVTATVAVCVMPPDRPVTVTV